MDTLKRVRVERKFKEMFGTQGEHRKLGNC